MTQRRNSSPRPGRRKLTWRALQLMLVAAAVPAFGLCLMGAKMKTGYCTTELVPDYPVDVMIRKAEVSNLIPSAPSTDLELMFVYHQNDPDSRLDDAGATVTAWSLSDPSMGTLTDLNRSNASVMTYTALKNGTVTITAQGTYTTANGKVPFERTTEVKADGFTSISSAPPTATSVALSAGTTTLFVPGPDASQQLNATTVQLSAAVTMSDASQNNNVSWSSSAPGVATVSSSGLVTAVSAGTATITATSFDGRASGNVTITVKTGGQASVTVQ